MSNPPDPTNLSQKFAALQALMTTQHAALMAEITALRGVGPENTLRSVNQALWNLAGAAPGATLVQIKAAIEALGGGKSMAELFGLWDPQGERSPYELLARLYAAFSPSSEGPLAYSLFADILQNTMQNGQFETDGNAILTRLIAQFDVSAVTPTIKDLLMTTSDQQAQLVSNTADPFDSPVGCCEMPFKSITNKYLETSVVNIEPANYAIWPETVPYGFDIQSVHLGVTMGYTGLKSPDWSKYRIYVASTATQFGMRGLALERYPTNRWITFEDSNDNPFVPAWEFFVKGDNRIDVYICPIRAQNPAPSLDGLPWLRQIGWNYLGVHTSAGNVQSKVYEPIFTTASTCTIGAYTLEFVSNPDGTRQIIGVGNQTPLKVYIGWNITGRTGASWIYSRAGFIGQGPFLPINDESWRSTTTQQPIGTAYNMNDAVGDAVEFAVFYPMDAPAPTDLDYFLSAGT